MKRLTNCLFVGMICFLFIGEAHALTFTIDYSNMLVGGEINGAVLEPSPVTADVATDLVGTLEVTCDNFDAPTTLQITSGNIDVLPNLADGPFRPGIGGTDSAAPGDFAFQANPNELIELALRDIQFELSSDSLTVSGNEMFSANLIEFEVDNGALDMRSPSMGGNGYDLAGLMCNPTGDELGTLLKLDPNGDIYQLSFIYERTIDISGLDSSIAAGSYLSLQGTITAQTEAVPEPSSLIMLCLGATVFLVRRRS